MFYMIKKDMRKLWILWWMWPKATANFYMDIIGKYQKKAKKDLNTEFPNIIINSIHVQWLVNWDIDKKVSETLQQWIKSLERAGADFICIPCNSAHNYIFAMRESVKIPVLSIMECVYDEIMQFPQYKDILLISTEYTIKNKLYEKACKNGVNIIVPKKEEQKIITRIISHILINRATNKDKCYWKKLYIHQRGK